MTTDDAAGAEVVLLEVCASPTGGLVYRLDATLRVEQLLALSAFLRLLQRRLEDLVQLAAEQEGGE